MRSFACSPPPHNPMQDQCRRSSRGQACFHVTAPLLPTHDVSLHATSAQSPCSAAAPREVACFHVTAPLLARTRRFTAQLGGIQGLRVQGRWLQPGAWPVPAPPAKVAPGLRLCILRLVSGPIHLIITMIKWIRTITQDGRPRSSLMSQLWERERGLALCVCVCERERERVCV